MFKTLKVVVAAASFAICALAADAATVVSTGTHSGTTEFTSTGGGPIVSSFNPLYAAEDAASKWVWDANRLLSPVTFTFTFDLTGYNIASAALGGVWGVNNEGWAYLNGVLISAIPRGIAAYNPLTSYSDAGAGFNAGMNSLTFLVQNDGVWTDPAFIPAAFRATVVVTAAEVPLPAALPLLGGAIAVLGFGAVRRRRTR